ncbi:AAA family ATPase [Planosporangium sp. 12N6]|uniref:AAA family ATPase n=1 Tax=Planosporangium spinosum TaxID=3402278 RepID=UPI003CF74B50
MIIWINGAFGAGKSAVTSALLAARPGWREFDPERIGYVLMRVREVPTGDFQDLPSWRALTVRILGGLARVHGITWVVPMTLLRADYRTEILGGLRSRGIPVHQMVLRVPEPVLRSRIDGDAELVGAREWRHAHVAPALAAFDGLAATEPGTVEVDAGDGRTPQRIAAEILDLVAARR